MLKPIYYLLIFLLINGCFTSFAQNEKVAPKYSNEFLSIGVGADALGQGNAVVAQTGSVNSGYWNPAGLTKVDKWLDVGMHLHFGALFFLLDLLKTLSHSILKSMKGQTEIFHQLNTILERSGNRIPQSTNWQKEILQNSIRL
jgi:hypothetical protein